LIRVFAQWGACLLPLALLYRAVILRYRFLTPLMLQALRLLAGNLKPIEAAHTSPGAVGAQLLLPSALITFLWSLRRVVDRRSQ
jgi:hypothetical protein